MAFAFNKQKCKNQEKKPRHSGAVSPHSLESGELNKNFDASKRYQKFVSDVVDQDECVDNNFRLRTDKELERIKDKMLDEYKFNKEQAFLLKMERKAKDKKLSFRRIKEEIDLMVVQAANDETVHRLRSRAVFSEFMLNRYQLKVSKEKNRLIKKASKEKRRLALYEFYNSSNLEVEINEIEYNSIGLQDISNIMDLFKRMKETMQNGVSNCSSNFLFGLANMLLTLATKTSALNKTVAICTFASICGASTSTVVITGFISSVVTYAASKIFVPTHEGHTSKHGTIKYQFIEEASGIASFLQKTLSADFVVAVRRLVMGLVAYTAFPSEIAGSVFSLIGTTALKLSGVRFISDILTVIVKICRSAALWWHGDAHGMKVPLSEIFFGASMFESLRETYAELGVYKDNVYVGLPVPGKMCMFVYNKKASDFLSAVKSHLLSIGIHHPDYRMLKGWEVDVVQWQLDINNMIDSSIRVPAFPVLVVGAPGTGKSITTNMLAARPSIIKGYKFTNRHVYYKNSAEAYWEGYKSREHNVIFMSEVAKQHKMIAKTKGDEALDSFLSGCDSNPYFVNMAFGEKGKVPFLAELFIMDSNNDSLNLDVLYSNVAAFWRRILIIYQKVKPEWQKQGSCEIDSQKVLDAGIKIMDAFSYTMERRIPINENISTPIIIGERDMGYLDMITLFDEMFVAHQARNTKVNAIVMDAITSIPSLKSLDMGAFNMPHSDEEKFLSDGVYGKPFKENLGPTPSQYMGEYVSSAYDQLDSLKTYLQSKINTGLNKKEDVFHEITSIFGTIDETLFDDGTKLQINTKKDIVANPTDYCHMILAKNGMGLIPGVEVVDSPDPIRVKAMCLTLGNVLRNKFLSGEETKVDPGLTQEMSQCMIYLNKDPNINDEVTLYNKVTKCLKLARDNGGGAPSSQFLDLWFKSIYSHYRKFDDAFKSIFQQVKDKHAPENVIGYNALVSVDCPQLSVANIVRLFDCVTSGVETCLAMFYIYVLIMCTYAFNVIYMGVLVVLAAMNTFYGLDTYITCVLAGVVGILYFWINSTASKQIVKHKTRVLAIKYHALADIHDTVNNIGAPQTRQMRDAQADKSAFSSIQNLALGTICVAIVCQTVSSIVGLFNKMSIKYQAGMSRFDDEDDDIESVAGCKTPYHRVKNVINPWQWNIQSPVHNKYLHTGSQEDFSNLIMEHTFYSYIDVDGFVFGSHVFGLTERYVALNTHYHKKARGKGVIIHATLGKEKEGSLFTISHAPLEFVDLGNDITIALCTRKFKNMVKHISVSPVDVLSGHIEDKTLGTKLLTEGITIVGNDKIVPAYEYNGYKGYGLCGNVLYGKVGKAYVIIGMHCAGAEEYDVGFSTPFIRGALESAIKKMNDDRGMMAVNPNCDVNTLLEPLGEPKKARKSPFRHMDMSNVVYYGMFGRAEINRKSDVRPNFMNAFIPKLEQVLGIPKTKVFVAPVMKPGLVNGVWKSPQNNALQYFTNPITMGHSEILSRVTTYLSTKLYERIVLEVGDIKLAPYRVVDAVNGSVDDGYLNRINASTAAGFSLPGKKKDYLLETSLDPYIREPDLKTCKRIRSILTNYDNGESSDTIFKVSLKDEPVTLAKREDAITRLFYVHELPHLIVCRMFLGPLVTLIQQTDAFYSMVGINMALQADKVFARLTKHPNYMEADAKKFDITAAYAIRLASFTLIYNLAHKMGYNERALKYLKGVLSDLLDPMYSMDGDVFSKSSVPSGHYGTAELNCLIILFFMVIAFFEGQDAGDISKDLDFFDHVSAALYGDDQSSSVADEVKESVNNEKIAEIYSRFAMELTAADKSPVIPKYVDIRDATFLKRSFVYSKYLGRTIAPLDPQSIYKMSSVSVFRDNCTEREHAISVANSALGEWFLHIVDRESVRHVYRSVRDVYVEAFMSHFGDGVGTENIFDFDKVESLFAMEADGPKILLYGRETAPDMVSVSGSLDKIRYECAMLVEPRPRYPRHKSKLIYPEFLADRYKPNTRKISSVTISKSKDELKRELEILRKKKDAMTAPYGGMELHRLCHSWSYANDERARAYIDDWILVNEEITSLEFQLSKMDQTAAYNDMMRVQYNSESGMQKSGTIDSATVVTHEVLTEIGGDESKSIGVYSDKLKFIDTPNDLNSFFLRPIEIGSGEITVGGFISATFDPWSQYLLDPAVRSKLRNSTYMRGTICVRVSVSGTPFDYGRLLLSCQPYHNNNASLIELFDGGAPTSWRLLRNQYLSQSKHSTVIDVKENKPVDFELPWIAPAPVGRLHNYQVTPLGSATTISDFVGMWRLYITTLNTLSSVSSSPSPVYYQVYAYVKDVQIGVPTGTQMTIVANSSKDERKTGPVQRIASSMYTVSKALEQVPVIGMYAKASSMAAGALGSIAALFGWSAPLIMSVPNRVKMEPFQNGTACIQNDTGQKISFDPKQELNVSTEYVGIYKDEMVIEDLCQIDSYLFSFDWQASKNPTDLLTAIGVHPQLQVGVTGVTVSNRNVVPTPMNMISQCFGVWHGDIVVTLEAVCSSFHRGKLLIMYEPNVAQFASVISNVNLNKQYTHIWDIQETQRYSICVDWNFHKAWAQTLAGNHVYNQLTGTITPTQDLYEALNGFLAIFPYTKLQSPDGSDIQINVYIHGENMMFNRPTSRIMPSNRAISYNSSKEVSNIAETCIDITRSDIDKKGISSHFYGEQPLSIRSLLKRFITSNVTSGLSDNNSTYSATFDMYPKTYGVVGVDSGTTPKTYFGHFRQAFLAMRGGMRKRIMIFTDSMPGYLGLVIHLLQEDEVPANDIAFYSGRIAEMQMDGSIFFSPKTNMGFEFEIPFYSSDYYVAAGAPDPFDPAAGPFVGGTQGYEVRYTLAGTPGVNFVEELSATAEDFQLVYFMGGIPYVSP